MAAVCISEGFQTDFSLLRQPSAFQKNFRQILAFCGSRPGSILQGREGGREGREGRKGEGRGKERTGEEGGGGEGKTEV